MTCLRRGGMFKQKFVANLLPSPAVKKFENRLIFGKVMGKSLVSVFFDSQCIQCVSKNATDVRCYTHIN